MYLDRKAPLRKWSWTSGPEEEEDKNSKHQTDSEDKESVKLLWVDRSDAHCVQPAFFLMRQRKE